MARITPIDVIKGISGKYGSSSNDYFATNTSSNKIRLAKLVNPYKGPATEKQLAQQSRFAARQAVATAWLNANKPSEVHGEKGTEAYQYIQKLKRQYSFSNITQVLYKYMDESNVINLPQGAGDSTNPPSGDSGTTTKRTLTLSANPAAGGQVTGAGQYDQGATASISATANSGYSFVKWSDGDTNATRSIVMTADKTLSAIFKDESTGTEGGGDQGGGME